MLIFKTKKDIEAHLSKERKDGKRIGLIPTMGALHQGHISLLDYTQAYCDVLVCSIFVNPTQFNNPEDLKKYPRPIEEDLQKLREANCDVLFLPEVDEMYTEGENWQLDLGELESLLEGAFRPGHFQGVTQVVSKLFSIIKPHVAAFGQKDFQQILVIKRMVELLDLPVEIKTCPVIREKGGLAMSSRNVRLSEEGKQRALSIYKSLVYCKQHLTCNSFEQVKRAAIQMLQEDAGLDLEYFEICNTLDLRPVHDCKTVNKVIALVAVWIDGVRLIDNMIIEIPR